MDKLTEAILDKVFTAAQLRALADQVKLRCEDGFGSVTITFWRGKPDLLEPTGSIKLNKLEEEREK